MPRWASNDRGEQRYTQSGHASLCKQWLCTYSPEQYGIVYSIWPCLDGQSMTELLSCFWQEVVKPAFPTQVDISADRFQISKSLGSQASDAKQRWYQLVCRYSWTHIWRCQNASLHHTITLWTYSEKPSPGIVKWDNKVNDRGIIPKLCSTT